ncbi:MAG: hypothetical protein WCL21_18015 [Mariniphaga sp.]
MKRFLLTFLVVAAVSVLLTQKAKAQQTINDSLISAMQADQENIKSDIELIKRLKITGYIQAQWQLADTAGINSFSGGNFPKTADNRFAVRRGRVKFTYDYAFSQFVLQLDATEKGVAIKDAYVAVMEPWAQFVTLTAGVFDRPFGYEISYSSSNRETPERARAFQSLFPGERDLGAKITLQPKKGTRFDFIKLDAGMFAGNGINPEFDTRKDFIGHLGIAKANTAQTFKYCFGVSVYDGGLYQATKYIYNSGTLADGSNAGFLVDSTTSNKNAYAKRQYMGVDAQFSLQSAIGITTVRGEYLWGKQPGSSATNQSTNSGTAPTTDTYNREFAAGYIYLIQNIGDTKNQLVIKYDWYDPNTKVSGNDIVTKSSTGKTTKLTVNDIKFSTLGLGWNYRFNPQVKFTAFYEIVKNETTGITGTLATNNYTKDLKDNVLTLRVQYKF